uniref:protein-serine/threonine phosphatase n=1 Tax=Anthurium amnicola TaxID=1678845 RepID=A0A1D1Y2F0_9ARAE
MGNSTSNIVGCFVPVGNVKDSVDLEFLGPLDEGLGHSFCYVRQVAADSPAITPSNSERFTIDSSTFDSETHSGSFRQEIVEDFSGLQRTNKNLSETTFKSISGASVSANVSTARTGNPNILLLADAQEPAASFESTASFAAIPLQPAPRGSGPLNGFMSGPLERGFASGPLEKGGGFMSGPLEKGSFMSGPLENMDRSNFSAPLSYGQRRAGFGHLLRSVSRPMRNALSRTFSRRLSGPSWMQRLFLQPMSQSVQHPKDAKLRTEFPRNSVELGPSKDEYGNTHNLQWAHGKAGEDRVHVVLSEEQGWLFVGIYDGFSGPDAPDFLMSNLYKAIDKELDGLLWEYEDKLGKTLQTSCLLASDDPGSSREHAGKDITASQLSSDNFEENIDESEVSVGLNEDESKRTCTVEKGMDVELANADEVEEAKKKAEVMAQVQGTCVACEKVNTSAQADEISDAQAEVQDVTHLQEATKTCEEDDADVKTRDERPPGALENEEIVLPIKFSIQGRKSKRLYELLQMELMEESDSKNSPSVSEVGSRRMGSWDLQPGVCEDLSSRECLQEGQPVSCSISIKEGGSVQMGEHINSRQNEGAAKEESKDLNQRVVSSYSTLGQRQMMRRSLIGSRLKSLYRKQKSLRKKLFPWSYDWHREQKTHVDEKIDDSPVVIRRYKSGPVDHDAVLRAITRALATTEEGYMSMVERALDKNPELALMGSCVLVMLMKDQDVYVMNVGDSRAILAQERLNDHHINPSMAKEDVRCWNRSRESFVRAELDKISEESPLQNPNSRFFKVNNNREISMYRLKIRAVQLSTDHSTSIEEEVLRIKAEHVDDAQSVSNDRVKGQLKVTRAFGAGFLKKPKFNEALLEMFRINYVGTSPYVSSIPSVVHHRLCSNDRFLVLSSDGLYEYFNNEEVVSHVAWFMDNVPEGDPAQYLITELLFRAAKKNGMDFHELLDIPHGDRRKYHDDVSVMVVSLEGRIWRSSG